MVITAPFLRKSSSEIPQHPLDSLPRLDQFRIRTICVRQFDVGVQLQQVFGAFEIWVGGVRG